MPLLDNLLTQALSYSGISCLLFAARTTCPDCLCSPQLTCPEASPAAVHRAEAVQVSLQGYLISFGVGIVVGAYLCYNFTRGKGRISYLK